MVIRPKKILRNKEYYLNKIIKKKAEIEELELAKKPVSNFKKELTRLRKKFKEKV